MLLGDTPREADVENVSNTGLEIWNCIFKDKSWLELALTFDGCSPVLLGYHLNRFGPTRKPTKLYVALLARDYSVNVYEVLTGCDEARLPLPKIFINRKNGVHSEYCFYTDMGIRGLGPSQILGYGTGSAHRGRALKKGAKLLLFDGKGQREYFIAPWSGKQRKIWI
ncbi:hypothetical protein BDW60DRAFT_220624 [Aspergillus nidulans var. acristatus]